MSGQTDPTTKAELQSDLDELVIRAYLNGVKVADCGYSLRHDDSNIPDWDMQIIQMAEKRLED